MEQALSRLEAGVALLRRRAEQLDALRGDAGELAARIVRLERVLDLDRVAAHLRREVAQVPLVADPVPHLRVLDVLPHETYAALVDAVPSPVFFDGSVEQGYDVRVPLRLAPASSMVAYRFLHDVARLLTDLVLLRFAEPLAAYTLRRFPSLPPPGAWDADLAPAGGRIVRRTRGYAGPPRDDDPWNLVTGIVDLARPADGPEYGGRLRDVEMPFRPNTLLAWVGPLESHAYALIPAGAPAATTRHSYEFSVGPARNARRRLAALVGQAI